ncbi:MAG: DeoR/GlpR family DNA-binding transcription regulator [Ferrovibrio sp.]|uniref:DeoR/GlpR family DNA-binding transcription regulator n=1 Tax=Ferrovibrio sp. TaxID=1917215 RepID=UPI00261AFDBB|nr:DeoR/GlpR family DNA-binding transcription regulator [Ferrovibrio sp.]MCW0233901.1 DeoR/GlpR family DNA-binding transcription regulator [Ferrovibrio sp.]
MIKAERWRDILQILNGDGAVSVAEMARRFGLSTMTIRRDLIELQQQGLLARTHGGAVLDAAMHGYARYESGTFEDRLKVQAAQKRAIAERAAQLVSDGDSLLINAGSTMTVFAQALRQHRNLHVVTNGLTVALELRSNASTEIFVLPGMLDRKKMSTVLQPDGRTFADLRPPSAFLGVVGVMPDAGPMMADPVEAAMNRAFIEACDEITLLVDSSKFSAQAVHRIVPMDQIDRIITDDGIGDEDRDAIVAQGIDLIVVSAPLPAEEREALS